MLLSEAARRYARVARRAIAFDASMRAC